MVSEITTKEQLLEELLKTDFSSLREAEKLSVLDYVLEHPLLSRRKLRGEVSRALARWIPQIPKNAQERVLARIEELTLEEAREDFYTYAKLMAPVVLPNDYIDGRHIKVICKELQAVADSIEKTDKPTKRSIFCLPPGAMKTMLCSILFPSWVYGNHPNWHVIAVGYNDEFAMDKIGQPLKDLMLTPQYRKLFPNTIIRQDSRGKDRFVTTRKGEFKALGARARAAGRRAHLLICDDAISEKDAWSKAHREEINKNYIGGLRSRLMRTPRGAEIIVSTRYHLEDLVGYVLKVDDSSKRPWKIIKIPAILDEEASKLLRERGDPPDKYVPGTSFWPEMQPLDLLEEEKQSFLKTEPFKWHALYMQSPTAVEGGIIKFDDIMWWDKEDMGDPKVNHILVSLDTAFSAKQRADFSAYTVWGVFYPLPESPPNLILLKAEKGKWEWPELLEKCEEVRIKWKPDFFIVEKRSSGQTLIQDMHQKGYPVVEFDPRGDKETRLQAAALWFRQGRIWLPEGKTWAMELQEEICNFPSVPHDDLTDTTSQAIIWYRDMGHIEHTKVNPLEDEDEGTFRSTGTRSYWKSLFATR